MTEAERLLLLLVADAMMHTAANALPREIIARIADVRRDLDNEAHDMAHPATLAALQVSMAPVRSPSSGEELDAASWNVSAAMAGGYAPRCP